MVQSWKETLTAPRRRVGATSERKSGTACFGSFFFFFFGGGEFSVILLSSSLKNKRSASSERG